MMERLAIGVTLADRNGVIVMFHSYFELEARMQEDKMRREPRRELMPMISRSKTIARLRGLRLKSQSNKAVATATSAKPKKF